MNKEKIVEGIANNSSSSIYINNRTSCYSNGINSNRSYRIKLK